jgi:hypothetical protein
VRTFESALLEGCDPASVVYVEAQLERALTAVGFGASDSVRAVLLLHNHIIAAFFSCYLLQFF